MSSSGKLNNPLAAQDAETRAQQEDRRGIPTTRGSVVMCPQSALQPSVGISDRGIEDSLIQGNTGERRHGRDDRAQSPGTSITRHGARSLLRPPWAWSWDTSLLPECHQCKVDFPGGPFSVPVLKQFRPALLD